MAEKKPDFVVSDRRKFTDEGELRTEVRDEPPAESQQGGEAAADPPPDPPSHAEQEAQHEEYRASGRKLDDILAAGGHGTAEDFVMSFEPLLQTVYVASMPLVGMVHLESESPRPGTL